METTANERVVRLLQTLGISQAEFSNRTGINTATTSNLVNHTKRLSAPILNKIKNAFPEVNIDFLVSGVGEPLLSPWTIKEPDIVYEEEDIKRFIKNYEEEIKILRSRLEERRKMLSILRNAYLGTQHETKTETKPETKNPE